MMMSAFWSKLLNQNCDFSKMKICSTFELALYFCLIIIPFVLVSFMLFSSFSSSIDVVTVVSVTHAFLSDIG